MMYTLPMFESEEAKLNTYKPYAVKHEGIEIVAIADGSICIGASA